MAENDPNKPELNPGDSTWNNKFGESGTPSKLRNMETSGGSSGDSSEKPSDDLGEAVRDRESTGGSWENNVTGKQSSPGGMRGFGGKAKTLFKKKGATAAIIMLLGGGAAIPFLGAAALPFSIVGNMDAKSMMHGLGQYSDDYNGFRLFTGKKTGVSSTSSKIKGLSDKEIAKLKSKGVDFEGAKKNSITRKTTFDSVKFNGETIHAGSEFKTAMRTDTAFRGAMKFKKGSYWKSAKSSFAARVRSLFRIDTNPDLSGKNTEEKNKKLVNESTEGDRSGTAKASGTEEELNKEGVDPNESAKAQAESVAGDLNGEVDAEKAAVKDGHFTGAMARESSMADAGAKLSQEGVDVIGGATQGLGGKILNFVSPLSLLTMVCTVYQVANVANVMARTVALFNIVRFAMTIRATIEKAKAGDDNGQSTQYLMTLLQQKDPATGQSFDETSYASFLFNGQLSSEPSSVSAFGGQAMIALYMAMHGVHKLFGEISHGFTLGLVSGSARNGRRFLKDVCKVTTNLAVQLGATALSFVTTIFSGGAGAGVQIAEHTAKTVVEKTAKDIVKGFIKREASKVADQGLVKYAARNSWKAFTSLWSHMNKWDKLGLLAAGVGTFGMGYIINTLAGGNVAGFTKNGFSSFDALGTGWDKYESTNGIASGGNMATYAQATAYQQTSQTYDNAYVADMQYQAKDTPLNIKTPYSALGAAIFGMQKMIGVSASMSLPSTLAAVAALPFKLPGLFAAHADSAPTPEQIGAQINNPYFQENKIATTVTGSPQVVFQKHYSFQDILDKLVDSSNPQISYGGTDPTSGDPILTVIDQDDGSDDTLSLSNYIAACHNPEKTEPDPEFSNDDDSNFYDTSVCVPGGGNYKDVYPLYDDAVRFLGQVNPDASDTSNVGSTTSIDGTVTSLSNKVAFDTQPVAQSWPIPPSEPTPALNLNNQVIPNLISSRLLGPAKDPLVRSWSMS